MHWPDKTANTGQWGASQRMSRGDRLTSVNRAMGESFQQCQSVKSVGQSLPVQDDSVWIVVHRSHRFSPILRGWAVGLPLRMKSCEGLTRV